MDVEIRVAGELQHVDRNRIKRIMLVQRDAPRPAKCIVDAAVNWRPTPA